MFRRRLEAALTSRHRRKQRVLSGSLSTRQSSRSALSSTLNLYCLEKKSNESLQVLELKENMRSTDIDFSKFLEEVGTGTIDGVQKPYIQVKDSMRVSSREDVINAMYPLDKVREFCALNK